MKSYILKPAAGVFAMFALVFSFSGCNLFDKADDVTFDLELKHTFVIDEDFDSQGEPVAYADAQSWDPKSDPEFEKYKDKIKEIKINKITYTVTDYAADGEVTFINGMGSFKATASTTSAIASAAIAIQSIQGSVGGNFELDYEISDLDQIAAHLETIEPIYFQVSGTLSQTPVAFKVPLTIHCTIVANALD
jgi:hypothetical protein